METKKNVFYVLIAFLSAINLLILLNEIKEREEILKDPKEYYCIELLVDKENMSVGLAKKKCDYYSSTGIWRD